MAGPLGGRAREEVGEIGGSEVIGRDVRGGRGVCKPDISPIQQHTLYLGGAVAPPHPATRVVLTLQCHALQPPSTPPCATCAMCCLCPLDPGCPIKAVKTYYSPHPPRPATRVVLRCSNSPPSPPPSGHTRCTCAAVPCATAPHSPPPAATHVVLGAAYPVHHKVAEGGAQCNARIRGCPQELGSRARLGGRGTGIFFSGDPGNFKLMPHAPQIYRKFREVGRRPKEFLEYFRAYTFRKYVKQLNLAIYHRSQKHWGGWGGWTEDR